MTSGFDSAPPLRGRVALVTGAGAGMGRSHALWLASAGAMVLAQDVDADAAHETAALVEASGGAARALVFDVANHAAAEQTVTGALQRFDTIDILVNNAGIFNEYGTEDIDEAIFWRMMNIHARGTFSVTRAALPGLKRSSCGRIVNISSNWGLVGHGISPHYCAAKAAILGFTKSWALEFAPWQITVNALAVGGVLTEMVMRQGNIEETLPGRVAKVPLGRYAEPGEITAVLAFLISPEAGFITGQTINVSGGETIVGI